ncbi:hypothetical protein [Microbulbifer halophilus]
MRTKFVHARRRAPRFGASGCDWRAIWPPIRIGRCRKPLHLCV